MRPSPEQIAVAAYHRWERRGHHHGQHLDDWDAARKDLEFGLNYRWVARHALRAAASAKGEPTWIGKPPAPSEGTVPAAARRCRFCERSAPQATFQGTAWTIPPFAGNTALVSWDDCDECRAYFDAQLAGAFETFARPILSSPSVRPEPGQGVPVAALKALARMGLAILPAAELHSFDDALEWVTNPEHHRDISAMEGLGCHVYTTPTPIPAPFASLARRVGEVADVPYMLFFLGAGQGVLQTTLPFSPRDEDLDLEGNPARGPVLSMSLGQGGDLRASEVVFLPAIGSRGFHAASVSPTH